MKVTVLVDNNTIIDRYFLAEPALCLLIQEGSRKILFDLGYSDVFIRNANKMKISLNDVDTIVFSHGHNDHTGGLPALIAMYIEEALEKRKFLKPDLICHKDTFGTKVTGNFIDIGSPVTVDKLKQHFNLNLTNEPFWITDKLVFLGEIPRGNSFENRHPVGKVLEEEDFRDDFLKDDSALAYKSKNGLVIITGCSHAGICNIIEYARKVTGESRVIDIIGGFHLLNPSKTQMDGTIEYFKELNPESIYACHCTDFPSKAALSEHFNVKDTGVSLELYYD